jgi:hypothetical protein
MSAMFSKPKAPPKPIAPPPPMPTPDDAAIEQAKRRAAAGAKGRSGRQSTMLAPDTSGTLLGG